ncbi:2-amino-3-ketobutyrate coenzyme A ligase [Gemmatimonadetes bacterium T265]|nr:2-amino-3-ketobutyrate coenzyme A ligase [Gemmatimonadetes bacterium T265]
MTTTLPPGGALAADLQAQLDQLKADRVYKRLNYLESPQGARVRMEGRGEVLILSSNNYLGLANEPAVVEAGIDALRRYGAGTASVRFICGTFTVHRELEEALARFVGTEAALSYVSAWNANEALTATVVEAGDFVISDELNHASIIDSIRLAKAIKKCTTAVYRHGDMDDLRAKLAANRDARRKLVWTDGVFSMEGSIAKLPDILEIAREFGAAVVMDDSHATGVLGATGRGTAEHFGVLGEVDVITSTLGKALGGAAGGFIAGPAALVDMMTQRSRPQLFSNALPPTVAASSLAAVRVAEAEPGRVRTLRENTRYFREAIVEAGFAPLAGETPIVPIIVGETAAAIGMSDALLDEGVFVTGFGFPVVPQGQARVRCQISAAHTREDLDCAVAAFKRAGRRVGVLR